MSEEQKQKKTKKPTKAELLQGAAQSVLEAVENARDVAAGVRDTYDEGVEKINAALARAASEFENILDRVKGVIDDARDKYETAVGDYEAARDEVESKLQELRDVREEHYQNWSDNLPENLQNSPTAEKLQTLLDIDLDVEVPELGDFEEPDLPSFDVIEMAEFEEPDLDNVEGAAQEVLDAELPQGFGRD